MDTSQLTEVYDVISKENKRMQILLCTAVFLLVTGTGIIAPLLAPYASTLDISTYAIGFLFSGFYIVRLVIGTPIGYFSEKYGSKVTLVVSLIIYPFVSLSYFFANDAVSLLSARLLHGIASAMMLPMAMAYMGNVSLKGKEGRYISILNTVILAASAIGPLFGGFIAQYFSIRTAFSCLFFLSLISLLVVILLPKENQNSSKSKSISSQTKTTKKTSSIYFNGNVLILALFNIVIAVFDIFIISFFPLYALKMHISASALGTLIAVNSIIMAILQIPFGQIVDRFSKLTCITISAFFMSIFLVITPYVTALSNWIGLSFFVITTAFCVSLCLAGVSAISVEVGKQTGMGRVMGFLGSASSFGMVIGPMMNAFLSKNVSYESIFYVTAAMWFITGVIFIFVVTKRRFLCR